jgi:hypothetical protein
MSNELKCYALVYGPEGAVADFAGKFARDQFHAHLPIPADAEPKTPCEPIYKSRRLAEEHWGSRFIYPHPGVSIHRGDSPLIERELRSIEQECYERYQPPSAGDAVALITFTVPTDPPALWTESVIQHYYDHGLKFTFRWWDMENYHRCVQCGALDGICLRAGAFWSVPSEEHTAYWYGEMRCHCSGDLQETRATGDNDFDDDDAIVSLTAFVDGPALRIISTWKTGKRTMVRVGMPGDVDRIIREIREMNHVLEEQVPVERGGE